MIAFRLAIYNTKRLLRHKSLRITFLVVPLAIAALRAIWASSEPMLYAARFCPVVCVLMISAVLYTQWSVDAASGLISGLCSCPISHRTVALSRVLSGAAILAVQMVMFATILAARF